ncbi:uncharacterized protein LOC114768373 isoform X1 [Denticeps clupeoides]|uniref:uncharacterized protein LOC114768373 isoform X1 n=1 Tax=Denticeps clupeoides TaxID=299321 RepID=UPI0010A2F6F0|nr:uncharacterized protein LOC114768373 isoform X1 [Denticeps clupeoides]
MACGGVLKLLRSSKRVYLASLCHFGDKCQRGPAAVQRYCTSTDNCERASRYPVPYRKDLPYDIVELMAEVETKGGFLPNVFKALSHRPVEFRAFFAYYNALMNKETGGLSKADRELVVVATSAHNNCLYCVVSHSALHRIYSKKPTQADQVAINYLTADLSARERVMLDFALAVCRSDTITEHHFQKLEEHGFDREDAWDIAAIAAFFAMSNRLAHLTGMRPNAEFYNMGRMPREKGGAPGDKGGSTSTLVLKTAFRRGNFENASKPQNVDPAEPAFPPALPSGRGTIA